MSPTSTCLLSRRRDGRDILELECERIWFSIRMMLPHHRYLHNLGDTRTAAQQHELERIAGEVAKLRRRSGRYRDVLRIEAWEKFLESAPF